VVDPKEYFSSSLHQIRKQKGLSLDATPGKFSDGTWIGDFPDKACKMIKEGKT
jgi:hypothetical protein